MNVYKRSLNLQLFLKRIIVNSFNLSWKIFFTVENKLLSQFFILVVYKLKKG